jgi:hypothetical protein
MVLVEWLFHQSIAVSRRNPSRLLRGRECDVDGSVTLLWLLPDPRYTGVMSETAMLETESEILEQVIESDSAGMTREAAQALLGFRFNTAAVARMNELAEKNRNGAITPSERALLERYTRVGNFLNLIHAKARCALA